ncbi:MAG TPA: TrbI/VirB10 family protein [Pyrinomonadaceae bacterium]|nr:TrbI/VirB10 family protein [Pyrinomonadaceae bacterium]
MFKNKLFHARLFILLLGLLILGGSVDTFAQKRKPVLRRKTTTVRKPVAPSLFAVPTGTTLRARINQTVNSKTARIGDRVTATVVDPVYSSNGVLVIPQGSTVSGRVDSVTPAAKGGKPGSIDLHFTQLSTPNGTRRIINGMLTDLVADKTRSDTEGTTTAKTMRHRKLIFIGGGTAGGAILGAAIGGGRGALIGGLLGAGGGYLGQKLTKGPEAEVPVGTEFGVYLSQGISLPRFGEVNP